MELTVLCALLLITAFLSVLLKRYFPEAAIGVGLLAGGMVMIAVIRYVAPALQSIQMLLEKTASAAYVGVLLRALGVCFLTQLTADTCRDAGEGALASKAELVGKIVLLVLALPMFSDIVELALSLMGEVS